jgi:hypothetical protein
MLSDFAARRIPAAIQFLIFLVGAALPLQTGKPSRAPKDPYNNLHADWRQIANATNIARARFLEEKTYRFDDGFALLPIVVEDSYKGLFLEKSPSVKVELRRENQKSAAAFVAAYRGKSWLMLLTRLDNDDEQGIFLTGEAGDAIVPAEPVFIKVVRDEISRQQQQLLLKPALQPVDSALDLKVAGLIEQSLNPETEEHALEQIEALGDPAVPSLIHRLDDRRKLPKPYLKLNNNFPGAFEAVRQYGPKQVVDALAAILNQITREHFGSIYNGGSDAERTQCVNGWRIYLAYRQQGILAH